MKTRYLRIWQLLCSIFVVAHVEVIASSDANKPGNGFSIVSQKIIHPNGLKEFTISKQIKHSNCSCKCACAPKNAGVETSLPPTPVIGNKISNSSPIGEKQYFKIFKEIRKNKCSCSCLCVPIVDLKRSTLRATTHSSSTTYSPTAAETTETRTDDITDSIKSTAKIVEELLDRSTSFSTLQTVEPTQAKKSESRHKEMPTTTINPVTDSGTDSTNLIENSTADTETVMMTGTTTTTTSENQKATLNPIFKAKVANLLNRLKEELMRLHSHNSSNTTAALLTASVEKEDAKTSETPEQIPINKSKNELTDSNEIQRLSLLKTKKMLENLKNKVELLRAEASNDEMNRSFSILDKIEKKHFNASKKSETTTTTTTPSTTTTSTSNAPKATAETIMATSHQSIALPLTTVSSTTFTEQAIKARDIFATTDILQATSPKKSFDESNVSESNGSDKTTITSTGQPSTVDTTDNTAQLTTSKNSLTTSYAKPSVIEANDTSMKNDLNNELATAQKMLQTLKQKLNQLKASESIDGKISSTKSTKTNDPVTAANTNAFLVSDVSQSMNITQTETTKQNYLSTSNDNFKITVTTKTTSTANENEDGEVATHPENEETDNTNITRLTSISTIEVDPTSITISTTDIPQTVKIPVEQMLQNFKNLRPLVEKSTTSDATSKPSFVIAKDNEKITTTMFTSTQLTTTNRHDEFSRSSVPTTTQSEDRTTTINEHNEFTTSTLTTIRSNDQPTSINQNGELTSSISIITLTTGSSPSATSDLTLTTHEATLTTQKPTNSKDSHKFAFVTEATEDENTTPSTVKITLPAIDFTNSETIPSSSVAPLTHPQTSQRTISTDNISIVTNYSTVVPLTSSQTTDANPVVRLILTPIPSISRVKSATNELIESPTPPWITDGVVENTTEKSLNKIDTGENIIEEKTRILLKPFSAEILTMPPAVEESIISSTTAAVESTKSGSTAISESTPINENNIQSLENSLANRLEQARRLREEQRQLEMLNAIRRESTADTETAEEIHQRRKAIEAKLAQLAQTERWHRELIQRYQLRQRVMANARDSKAEISVANDIGVHTEASPTSEEISMQTTSQAVRTSCEPVKKFISTFRVRDPNAWLRDNCVIVKKLYPTASCSQIQQLLSGCF